MILTSKDSPSLIKQLRRESPASSNHCQIESPRPAKSYVNSSTWEDGLGLGRFCNHSQEERDELFVDRNEASGMHTILLKLSDTKTMSLLTYLISKSWVEGDTFG